MDKPFDDLILRCVEDGLSYLVEDGVSVVLWLAETKLAFTKKQIPSHAKELSELLANIFGPGARILESQIVKEIRQYFALPDGIIPDLPTAVQVAREKYIRQLDLKQQVMTHRSERRVAD